MFVLYILPMSKIEYISVEEAAKNRHSAQGYLRDSCLTAQDAMKATLDYFGISHE